MRTDSERPVSITTVVFTSMTFLPWLRSAASTSSSVTRSRRMAARCHAPRCTRMGCLKRKARRSLSTSRASRLAVGLMRNPALT